MTAGVDRAVFISYSRRDRPYVEHLAKHLDTVCGIPTWWDHDLEAGDSFWTRIGQAIDGCSVLVVVLSPSSVASPYVEREINRAQRKGRAVVPLLLHEIDDFPIQLEGIQYWSAVGGSMPPCGFLEKYGVSRQVPHPPQAPPAHEVPLPVDPSRELAVRRFLDENPARFGHQEGYPARRLTPAVLQALVERISDPQECLTVRPPYFRLGGRLRATHDRKRVDEFVLGHRPPPTGFIHGVRLALWDEELLPGPSGVRLDLSEVSDVVQTDLLLAAVRLRSKHKQRLPVGGWVVFTEVAVTFVGGDQVIHVPYPDLAELFVDAPLRRETLDFDTA